MHQYIVQLGMRGGALAAVGVISRVQVGVQVSSHNECIPGRVQGGNDALKVLYQARAHGRLIRGKVYTEDVLPKAAIFDCHADVYQAPLQASRCGVVCGGDTGVGGGFGSNEHAPPTAFWLVGC